MAREQNANAFPYNVETAKLTDGPYNGGVNIILWCIKDSNLTLTDAKGNSVTQDFDAGSSIELDKVSTVKVNSGEINLG